MEKIFTMDVEQNIKSALSFSNLLKKHRIKGEFYICGYIVEKYPKECQKIAKYHTIGGHGYNHENFSKLSFKQAENIILKTKNKFKEHNISMIGWRFPGFRFKNNQLRILVKHNIFDSSIRSINKKKWGIMIPLWNLLSNIKRGSVFFPSLFPKDLKEKYWDITDLNDLEFYNKKGRFVMHCYKYQDYKDKLEKQIKILT